MDHKGMAQVKHPLYLLAILITISSCTNSEIPGTESIRILKPTAPVQVKLSIQESPSQTGLAHLTMQVTSLMNTPLIRIKYILPEHLEVIGGEPLWNGSMIKGEIRTLEITVLFKNEERYVVQGIATIQHNEDRIYSAEDSIIIDFGRQGGILAGIEAITPETGHQSTEKGHSKPLTKKSRDLRDVIEFRGE
jgi:hypothetical protein